MKDYRILPCGDAALVVTFGDVISERTASASVRSPMHFARSM